MARAKSKPHKTAKRKAPAKLSAAAKKKIAAGKAAATRKANRAAEIESLRLSEEAYFASLDVKRRVAAKKKKLKIRKGKAKARQLATRARKGGKSLLGQLEDAYERMAGGQLELSIERSPIREKGQQPWLLLGTFVPIDTMDYAELGRIFGAWEDDLTLAVMVHPQRYSLIRIIYQRFDEDGEPLGKPEGYSPTSSGAWEYVVSEARHDMIGSDWGDPDEDSLAARYAGTAILAIEVLWSASMA